MIIIWRGWGAAVIILILLAGGFLGGTIGSAASSASGAGVIGVGLGLLASAAGSYFFGIWLNKTRPATQIAQQLAQRQAAYHQLVESGQFSRGPQYPRPMSLQDARQQAQAQLAEDQVLLSRGLTNYHTLFWIPVQYVAIVAALAGIGLLIAGIVS